MRVTKVQQAVGRIAGHTEDKESLKRYLAPRPEEFLRNRGEPVMFAELRLRNPDFPMIAECGFDR